MARIQDVLSSSFLAILLLICCHCDEYLCDIITGSGLVDHQQKINNTKNYSQATTTVGYSVNNNLGGRKFETYSEINRFPERELTYAFNSGPYMLEEAKEPIREAIRRWASVSGHYFVEFSESVFRSAHIKIGFYEGDHSDTTGCVNSFGPGGLGEFDTAHTVLYHPTNNPHAQIHFNRRFKWASDGSTNAYDIKSIALHEMGHVLGLDHSPDPNTIMWYQFNPGERKDLSPDDIAGIRYMYNWRPRRSRFCCG